MKQHFVTFYSPGTFFAEDTTKEIDSWDVEKAREMAASIIERYNARPYGFRFTTRSRGPKDLDSKVTATSYMYYIGGRVRTLAEVRAAADPDERILLSNMESNGYARIWQTTEGWRWTQPLSDDDIVLEAPQQKGGGNG